jgi:hypothetical protein
MVVVTSIPRRLKQSAIAFATCTSRWNHIVSAGFTQSLFQWTRASPRSRHSHKLFILAQFIQYPLAMIEIIRQSGMNLSQRQTRQLFDDLVGCQTLDFRERVNILYARPRANNVRAILPRPVRSNFNVSGNLGLHTFPDPKVY